MGLLPRLALCLFLALAAAAAETPGETQKTEAVNHLLDQIAQQEHSFVRSMAHYSPIVETYIQDMGEGSEGLSTADHYFLGKLDLSKGISFTPLTVRTKSQKNFFAFLKKRRAAVFHPEGFVQMIFPDASDFDREHYKFEYIRREFLGEVRCFVFDVSPRNNAAGKFVGRIWVEDSGDRLVRFNGTYTDSRPSRLYFHFDSWRNNAATGEWLPAYIYVEENGPVDKKGDEFNFKGQTRLWGYKPVNNNRLDELTNILVDGNSGVKDQTDATKDVSPIESQRAWERQAEDNILDRLERTGLLAPKSAVDGVLNTVVNNLLATSNLNLDVECRVLLTTPLETFSLQHTIVISRGLIDVLPDEASLAMVLANELAQIALGYTIQTRYAFYDEMMFADEETLERFRFERTPEQIAAAGQKAIQILEASPYKDKLGSAVLFLRALNARSARLPSLIKANLGNELGTGANLARLLTIVNNAPKLNENSLTQIAALPLGSRVKLDPYSSDLVLVKTKPVALLSPREKMPFEVTPFMPYLTRVESVAAKQTEHLGQ